MNLTSKKVKKFTSIYFMEKDSVDPMVCTFLVYKLKKYPIDMVLRLHYIIKTSKQRGK